MKPKERKAFMILLSLAAFEAAFPDSQKLSVRWLREDLQHQALILLQMLDLSIRLPENMDVLTHPLGKKAKKIVAVVK